VVLSDSGIKCVTFFFVTLKLFVNFYSHLQSICLWEIANKSLSVHAFDVSVYTFISCQHSLFWCCWLSIWLYKYVDNSLIKFAISLLLRQAELFSMYSSVVSQINYCFWKGIAELLAVLQESIWPVVGNADGDVCNYCNEVGWELWRFYGYCTPLIRSCNDCYQVRSVIGLFWHSTRSCLLVKFVYRRSVVFVFVYLCVCFFLRLPGYSESYEFIFGLILEGWAYTKDQLVRFVGDLQFLLRFFYIFIVVCFQ